MAPTGPPPILSGQEPPKPALLCSRREPLKGQYESTLRERHQKIRKFFGTHGSPRGFAKTFTLKGGNRRGLDSYDSPGQTISIRRSRCVTSLMEPTFRLHAIVPSLLGQNSDQCIVASGTARQGLLA